ncbi:hypothetical protein FOB47_25140 [Cupriavidus gilardii]|nr:hypothetical protein FOB47_25140 [Cupriavidus gilardii]
MAAAKSLKDKRFALRTMSASRQTWMGIRTAARARCAESRVGAQSEVELLRPNAKRGGNLLARRFAQTLAAFLLRVRRLGDADWEMPIRAATSDWVSPRCSRQARAGVAPSTVR